MVGIYLFAYFLVSLLGEVSYSWDFYMFGTIFAAVACPYIAYQIMKKRNLYGSYSIIIAFGIGIISLILGALGGLIPVAYLTTRDKK